MSTPLLPFSMMWHEQQYQYQQDSLRRFRRPRSFLTRFWPLAIFVLFQLLLASDNVAAIDLSRLYGHMANNVQKRSEACHPYEPFKCPGDGNCISIQYLCDGAPDCSDGYDEDLRLCTAAKRPPVEETASFLQSLIASHGPNYLEKLFGSKARDALAPLGGVEKVAIALSESQTIEDFGAALHLMRSDLEHLRSVFMAVENGDLGMLKSLGIKDSELGDVKFFLEKLVNTGFLD
ncbi:IDLSRF-like peptide isoform X2 [Eurosta solidaginis]|uniref:IDLSRF-like peptide isoform X2 n=1 Tax=Eurosta solidaginis TaxID=178769 RepID=UPI003530B02D